MPKEIRSLEFNNLLSQDSSSIFVLPRFFSNPAIIEQTQEMHII